MTLSTEMQCATAQTLESALSHNTPEVTPVARELPTHSSLKGLAGVVLGRTLPRTLPAQSAQSDCTLVTPGAGKPHKSEPTEIATLMRQCADAYGFTEQEHAEALAVALADPAKALICFRTIVRDLCHGE